SAQYPDGVFHAHPEFHVIKKESIGLIEAQGLFILPGRLEKELGEIRNGICDGAGLPEHLSEYEFIYGEIVELCGGKRDVQSVEDAIKKELGSVCKRILKNTAVFKDEELTVKFIKERALKND
ncbi:MAG: galactose-1-phosphate uridylyltransferase, partial [Clostridiales bacterium]|nr:galactose-1-phosphate uridylyltransferase [Clostridiales bacterium]